MRNARKGDNKMVGLIENYNEYKGYICPYCNSQNSYGQGIEESEWHIVTCKDCGKNFEAKKVGGYQSRISYPKDEAIQIMNYEHPICPRCNGLDDGEREVNWYWDYMTCKKCGRNFEVRIAKVFQTRPIEI